MEIKALKDKSNPDYAILIPFRLPPGIWHYISVYKSGEMSFSFNRLSFDDAAIFHDALALALEAGEVIAGRGIPVDEWLELVEATLKRQLGQD